MSEKRKIQLFEKRNIPKFLSSQVFRKFENLLLEYRLEKREKFANCWEEKVVESVPKG